MIDRQLLREYCVAQQILLTDEQLAQFDDYANMLVEWNKKINLTAIVQPDEIVIKHFVDSLMLLRVFTPAQGANVVDVGAGAGFPSVPVKIARPDIKLTLMDSLNKRIVFLQELSAQLLQQNNCVHLRAEEAGMQAQYREQFDLATARAVAHLRELAEYCLPMVRVGGTFAALKSGETETEMREAARAISVLGGRVERVERFNLPDGSGRSIVLIKKISQTSTKYPRPHAKIAKKPLV